MGAGFPSFRPQPLVGRRMRSPDEPVLEKVLLEAVTVFAEVEERLAERRRAALLTVLDELDPAAREADGRSDFLGHVKPRRVCERVREQNRGADAAGLQRLEQLFNE